MGCRYLRRMSYQQWIWLVESHKLTCDLYVNLALTKSRNIWFCYCSQQMILLWVTFSKVINIPNFGWAIELFLCCYVTVMCWSVPSTVLFSCVICKEREWTFCSFFLMLSLLKNTHIKKAAERNGWNIVIISTTKRSLIVWTKLGI